MILPPVDGTATHSNPFIYTACDTDYFDSFGPSLVNSVQINTKLGMHVHIFNARDDQISWCRHRGVTVTHESVTNAAFDIAAARWTVPPVNDRERNYYDRTCNAMSKSNDADMAQRMQKTYYACARFIRLFELFDASVPVFAMDIDAIVRSNILPLPLDRDFYVHQIHGKKARILAGGMYLNPTKHTQQFLGDYANALKQEIVNDYLYWGLDQDLLDKIVPRYNHGALPMNLIDWNMGANSAVWTAKGTRKADAVFVNEIARYKSVLTSTIGH